MTKLHLRNFFYSCQSSFFHVLHVYSVFICAISCALMSFLKLRQQQMPFDTVFSNNAVFFFQTLKCLISQAVGEAAPHWLELFLWGNDRSSWASYSGWEKAVIWNIWICKSVTTALTLSEVAVCAKQANQPPWTVFVALIGCCAS